jgi:plasmid stability protein
MGELVLTDVEDDVLHRLQERATCHGRTLAEEAKAILAEALHGKGPEVWAAVDAIYHRLVTSDRTFSDSAGLLREDRDRRARPSWMPGSGVKTGYHSATEPSSW